MSAQDKFSLVLYGAGKNAKRALDKVKSMGYNPMCFVDADENKQGTSQFGLAVLSFDEVKNLYSDFAIWVTVADFHIKCSIFSWLIENEFPKERILILISH